MRLGYAGKGAIYLLMGVLALRLVAGAGGRITDASGVLRTFVSQPFGWILLSVIGIGMLAYAAWHSVQALISRRRQPSRPRDWFDRALTIIKAIVYGAIGWEAMQLVFARPVHPTSADEYARDAMQVPFGRWFLALIGIGIAWYGITQLRMAWNARFDDDVDQHQLRSAGLAWVLHVGRAGTAARGIIQVVMGYALVQAAVDRSPSKAGGIADALWTLFSQPYGRWLLAATAAGLAAYGLFQLLHARYARLNA